MTWGELYDDSTGMGSYIVHKNGAQLGPFTSEGLRQQVTSGHLAAGDMAWDKARGEWLPV